VPLEMLLAHNYSAWPSTASFKFGAFPPHIPRPCPRTSGEEQRSKCRVALYKLVFLDAPTLPSLSIPFPYLPSTTSNPLSPGRCWCRLLRGVQGVRPVVPPLVRLRRRDVRTQARLWWRRGAVGEWSREEGEGRVRQHLPFPAPARRRLARTSSADFLGFLLAVLGVSMEFLVSRSGGRPERHGARSTCRRQRCERKRRTWRRNMEVTAASNWRPRA
jgi:hypothetical protein